MNIDKSIKSEPGVYQIINLINNKRYIGSSLTCLYCGLQSKGRANMKRYHFDNCKNKNE